MRDGQASTTAKRVALQRLRAPRAAWAAGRPLDDQSLQADVSDGLDGAGSPEMGRYLAARTAFFDRAVVGAVASVTPQVVLAGAGYDGRALRYEAPGVRFFELDHPATQADKRARLARLGIDTAGIAFGPVDFSRTDAGQVLASIGFDRAAGALFVCEGVAPYLPEEVLASLLASLAGSATGGGRLATELALVPRSPEAAERRARLTEAVAALGEPFLTALDPAGVAGLLTRTGWAVETMTGPAGQGVEDPGTSVAFVLARSA